MQVYKGEYGFDLTLETGFDLSDAQTLTLLVEDATGHTDALTAALGGTQNIVRTVEATDFLVLGIGMMQGMAEWASGATRYTVKVPIEVLDPLEETVVP